MRDEERKRNAGITRNNNTRGNKMSKGKTRLGLLALCATAAMAMMAFAASGAQAEARPAWMINGNDVTSDLTVSVVLTEDVPTKLLTSSGGTPVAIECTEYEVPTALLLAEGKADGEVWFRNCETYLGSEEVLSEPCKPTEPIKAGGTLEIVLHEGEPLVKATGTGGTFTTLEFGEECSLPEEVPITGTGWILDCELEAEEEKLIHLIEEGKAAAAALGGLKFGKNPATIDGSLNVEVFHSGNMVEFSALG
jgi:hypothetical protein